MIFSRFEKYLFLLIVLIHCFVVLRLHYFVSHDGPAHVYNSNLINHLIFNRNSAAGRVFEFTPEVLPNWTGHALLSFLLLIFPAALAEKLLVVIYIILLCYSFRLLVRVVNPETIAASYLIFPFVFSFPIHGGIYSFCIGVGLLLFTLWYFVKYFKEKSSKHVIGMTVMILLLYFSHIVAFLSALICIAVLAVQSKALRKNIFWLFPAVLIPLILTAFFASGRMQSFAAPNFKQSLDGIVKVAPLISFTHEDAALTVYMFYLYGFVALSIFFHRRVNIWLLISGLFFLLYFLVPDSAMSGGVISLRLSMLGFIFLFIFFTSARKNIMYFAAITSVVFSFVMIIRKSDTLKDLSDAAVKYSSLKEHIQKGSTLLPINYIDNWMFSNMACYIGSEKEIIVLDNYEADKLHFPLRWKPGKNPYRIIGNFGSVAPCVDLSAYRKQTGIDVDYVLIMGQPKEDSCYQSLKKQLSAYHSVYSTPEVDLYQLQ